MAGRCSSYRGCSCELYIFIKLSRNAGDREGKWRPIYTAPSVGLLFIPRALWGLGKDETCRASGTKVNVYKGSAFPQDILWDSLSGLTKQTLCPMLSHAFRSGDQSSADNTMLASLKFALFGNLTIISCAWSNIKWTSQAPCFPWVVNGGTAWLIRTATFLLQHATLWDLRPDLVM